MDYFDRFPRGSLEGSLHLIEDISPAAIELRTVLGLDTGDPFQDGTNRAWALIDYACATPERTGDDIYFNAAESELDSIIALPGAVITDPRVMNARLLKGSLSAFRARAATGELPTPEMKDDFQKVAGEVLCEYAQADVPDDTEYFGRVSELMSLYALLLCREFPFMASPREEANVYTPDNHDHYILDYGPNGLIRLPVSVKHVGPLDPNHLVLTLRMGFVAGDAARAAGLWNARQPRTEPRERPTIMLVEAMMAHADGQVLERKQLDILRHATYIVRGELQQFRDAGYSRLDQELPVEVPRQRHRTR